MYAKVENLYTNMSRTSLVYDAVLAENDSSEGISNMTFTSPFTAAFSVMFYRYMFIVIYSVIFIFCIIGNTLVLIVTVWSVRMKTRTNFFLANLAAADLCVGILCVLPNLHNYLYFKWLLGKAMCKVHYFTESFTLCASVLFLAVIAVERYIAVMHPLRAKGLFTKFRMHTAQVLIWLIAAVYSLPLLIIYDTFQEPNSSGAVTEFCNLRVDVINLKIYFTFNFVFWYVLPLFTMAVAYAIISWTLWHSGRIFNKQKNNDAISNTSSTKMTTAVKEQRSYCNASSSSSYSDGCGSGARGAHSDGSQRESLASVAFDSPCRDYSINIKSRCCYGYSDDTSERSPAQGDDEYGQQPPKEVSCSRSDDSEPPQLVEYEHNSQTYKPWHLSEDATRAEDGRNKFRQPSFVNRVSDVHNKNNAFEMSDLNTTCLPNERPNCKRSNGIGGHSLPQSGSKRRFNRRSFHSDHDSSPGKASGYDITIQRYRPVMSVRVLSSRRKVVRLLVLVLFTFALCVLPNHVRLLMFYWNVYPMNNFGVSFFPPLAFICMYLNSALNPVLYSLFSESFRRSLRECFRRACQRSKSFLSGKIEPCCSNL